MIITIIRHIPYFNRIFNIVIAIIYAIIYDYVYDNYICVVFEMENSAYHFITNEGFIIYLLIASLPFFFYNGIKTIAAALSLFIYIFAYIPMVNNLLTWGYTAEIQQGYLLVFFVSMCLFFISDRLYLCKGYMQRERKTIPFVNFERLTLLLFLLVVFLQRGNIHFVNFLEDSEELYDLRASNSMSGNYLIAWLRSAFLPLLMVTYLYTKQYKKYALSFVAYIVIFMIDKQKITFIFPFVLTGLFYIATIKLDYFYNYFQKEIRSFLNKKVREIN